MVKCHRAPLSLRSYPRILPSVRSLRILPSHAPPPLSQVRCLLIQELFAVASASFHEEPAEPADPADPEDLADPDDGLDEDSNGSAAATAAASARLAAGSGTAVMAVGDATDARRARGLLAVADRLTEEVDNSLFKAYRKASSEFGQEASTPRPPAVQTASYFFRSCVCDERGTRFAG